jgi:hypothetical protein
MKQILIRVLIAVLGLLGLVLIIAESPASSVAFIAAKIAGAALLYLSSVVYEVAIPDTEEV